MTFVDSDPASMTCIRENLAGVGLGDAERDGDATLVRADVGNWVSNTVSRYDLILCDPPYAFEGWSELVGQLPADLAILESGSEIVPPEGWRVIKTRRYGSTLVTVARPDRVTEKGVL